MFMRKFLVFAITSGLAGKLWRAYGNSPRRAAPKRPR